MLSVPEPASSAARALAAAMGVSVTFADVLVRRGLGNDSATRQFLAPKLADLTSPTSMCDRDAAASRIAFAVRHQEPIVVFGDYDCDGMTSTAILTDSLRKFGAQVTPLLASRFAGGYGLSTEALDRILACRPRLLITCDCGSSDHVRLLRAREAGVDVIVIDHHLVPTEPLPALAFLNPHRPECAFPYKGLASCGLALSVAAAVRAELKHSLDLRSYLDLVAIGTIADVAPLNGDNRCLVRAGLALLTAGSLRPGLRALGAYARLETTSTPTAQDIAFRLAPRLNAPGRLGAPDDALAVLLASQPAQAHAAAAACEQANLRRREIQDHMVAEAIAEVAARGLADQPAMVLAREGWHVGVVGIVAGRLAATYQRPVIVAAIDEGVAHGSVRSAAGVGVVTALRSCSELLLSLGGHEKAAGVRFAPAHLDALQEAFSVACQQSVSADLMSEIALAVRLDPADDPARVVSDLAQLEPCGEGNPAPTLCWVGARLRQSREVRGGHLQTQVEAEGRTLKGFGIDLGSMASSLGERVHIWGGLRRATWRGAASIEVHITNLVSAS